jgi:hypothetical protein
MEHIFQLNAKYMFRDIGEMMVHIDPEKQKMMCVI